MTELIQDIIDLGKMTTAELKVQWSEIFGGSPPNSNPDYLRSRLRYRLQERALGAQTRTQIRKLERLAKTRDMERESQAPVRGPKYGTGVSPGTTLIRIYNGVEHHALVLGEGFEYQGATYRSLSAIAKAITGTQWNGKTFFGLNK